MTVTYIQLIAESTFLQRIKLYGLRNFEVYVTLGRWPFGDLTFGRQVDKNRYIESGSGIVEKKS